MSGRREKAKRLAGDVISLDARRKMRAFEREVEETRIRAAIRAHIDRVAAEERAERRAGILFGVVLLLAALGLLFGLATVGAAL